MTLVRRDDGTKSVCSRDSAATTITHILVDMQASLLNKARKNLQDKIIRSTNWDTFCKALNARNLALAPWCGVTDCEEDIKQRSGEAATNVESSADDAEDGEKLTGAAKSLCVPFEQPDLSSDAVCVGCSKKAICWCLFGRSY